MAKTIKVKCWKCGGKGWLVNHALGIGTFGIGYLLQAVAGKPSCDEDCPICDGTGYQEISEDAYLRGARG